jgi:membrane protease YdiL (CAAX protease family)
VTLNRLRIVSLAVCLAMTLLAWMGFWFQDRTLMEVVLAGAPPVEQTWLGALLGFLFSASGLVLTHRARWLQSYRNLVFRLLNEIDPHPLDLVAVSLCAGWGEELFFRGLLQPYLGIVATSVLFWLAHGTVSFSNWRVNLYGLCVFGAGVLLGLLYEWKGLLSAMVAHAMVDATTLMAFYWMRPSPVPAPTVSAQSKEQNL